MRRLLLFLLLIPAFAYCRIDTSQFYHFTVDNGLPSNNVYSTLKDRAGFIWIATDNGVAKYDGYSFKVFTTSDGLPTNDVWRLYEDKQNKIWLFSNSHEIGYIRDDKYYSANIPNPGGFFYPIGITSTEWMVMLAYTGAPSRSSGVSRYLTIIINKYPYNFRLAKKSFVQPTLVKSVVLGESNSLWLFYDDGNVSKINILNPFGEKTTFFSTNHGTYDLNERANVITANDDYAFSYAQKDSVVKMMNLERKEVAQHAFNRAKGESIVVSYFREGILYFLTNKAFYKVKNGDLEFLFEPKIPSDNQITFVAEYGDEWYCTHGDGIWIKPKYATFENKIASATFLRNYAFAGSVHGSNYWWNNQESTLLILNDSGKRVFKLPRYGVLKHASKSGSKVRLLFSSGVYDFDTSSGKLYNIFQGKALVVNEPFYNVSDKFTEASSILYVKNLRRLYELNDSVSIVCSNISVDILTEKKSHFQSVTFINERLTQIATDPKRRFFCLYSSRSLYICSIDLTWKISLDYNQLRYLGLENIIKVVSTDDSWYLLTKNKLLKCNPKGEYSVINTNLNLSSSDISIHNRQIVLSGQFGIAFAPVGQERFKVLVNYKNECYKQFIESCGNSDNSIFLLTEKGYFKLHPDSSRKWNLQEVSKDGFATLCFSAQDRKILKASDSIAISEEQKNITITPINFSGNNKAKIYFKADQNDWQVSSSNELPTDIVKGKAGNLFFYVQDGFWTSDVRKIYVRKIPYWYKRVEWQLSFAISILTFSGISIYAISALTKKQVAKAAEKRRLQTELELRAIYSQINPHFIFNTLSTALYFISKQQTKDAYTHVSKFSKLLRSYLKSSRERFITLADEIDILKQYIELQRARFSKQFHYEITVTEELIPSQVWLPSLLLQPLIENAINHGLFNKGDSGFLNVSFSKGINDTELICIIDDNGIGRVRAKELNRRYRKEKSSYGTELTRELIDIFKRYEHMDITLEYLDKTEPETGTTVKLTIRNVRTVSPA